MLNKKWFVAVVLALVSLAASGCGSILPVGPNRMLRFLGPNSTGDFATFEGIVSRRCVDVSVASIDAAVPTDGVTVGCVMKVNVVGSAIERTVFCPLGKMREECAEVPLHARISVNGRPMGDQAVAYLPESINWQAN